MEEQNCHSHVGVKIVGRIVLGIVLVVAILQQAILPSINSVAIIGQGRVPVTPDIAVLDLSVATIKVATVDEALFQTTQKIQNVQKALDEMGVAKEDQQITGYAFNPVFESATPFGDSSNGATVAQECKIIGYNGLQKITIKVRGIDKNKDLIDQVIQRVAKEGVNQIGSVNFVYSDIEKAKQQAREKAVVNAQSKADSMQKIAGVKIGKIIGWYESILTAPGQTYSEGNYSYNSNSIAFGNENSPVSNSSNSQTEVIVEVTVNYSVR